MLTFGDRMRRARTLANLSQQALATQVGVQRSAVAQWEKKNGSLPSMHHLVKIALVTGVSLEWLGTGRGAIRPDADGWVPAVRSDDFAQDEIEFSCLLAIRRLPHKVRENLAGMIDLMAKNFA